METMTWVLIGLVVLSYAQYTFPDKVNPWVGKVWDKVNEFVKFAPKTGQCSTDSNPVCANNVTYTNACIAQRAGVTNAKAGAC